MRTISLRVDDDVFNTVVDIAARCNKSRPEIILESIQARIEYEAWFKNAIAEARKDVKDGNVVSNEDAVRHMDKLINEG